MTNRTMLTYALLGMGCAALAAGGGCARPEPEAFVEIRLGEKLAVELPPETRECGFGWRWSTASSTTFPTAGSLTDVRVLTDDTGNVIAKSLRRLDVTHWGLCVSGSYQYALEVAVPPQAYRDPPPSWKVPSPYLGSSGAAMLLEVVKAMMARGMVSARTGAGVAPSPDATFSQVKADYLNGKLGLLAFLAKANLDRVLPPPGAVPRSGAPPSALPTKETFEAKCKQMVPIAAGNIPEYLLLARRIMDFLPAAEGFGDPADLGVLGDLDVLRAVVEFGTDPALLEGTDAYRQMTRPDASWRAKKEGVSVEVRNLGGRRIRFATRAAKVTPSFFGLETIGR